MSAGRAAGGGCPDRAVFSDNILEVKESEGRLLVVIEGEKEELGKDATGAVDMSILRTSLFLFSPLSECGVGGRGNEGFDERESSNGDTKGTRTIHY